MRIMLTLAPTRLAELPDRIRALQRGGIDAVGIGDSPGYAETYVALTVAASVDATVALGPMVTNLITRTPAVGGQAVATLSQLAPGRIFVGVGAGDSALVPTGARPTGPTEFVAGVRQMRATWSEALRRAGRPPAAGLVTHPVGNRIVVAANGPRMIAAASAIADIVVTATGIDAPTVTRAAAAVADGAVTAGRAGAVEHWCVARIAVHDDGERAVDELRPLLASGANHVFAAPAERVLLPPGLRERVEQLRRRYDYRQHGARIANPNAALVDHLDLRAALARRFALAGDPATVATGLARLAEAGVAGVVIPAVGLEVDRLIDRLGTEVLPEWRRRGGMPVASR